MCVFYCWETRIWESWWGTINGKVEGRGKSKRDEDGKNDLVLAVYGRIYKFNEFNGSQLLLMVDSVKHLSDDGSP